MLCGLGWMLDGMIVSEGDAPMAEEKIRYPLKNKLIANKTVENNPPTQVSMASFVIIAPIKPPVDIAERII